MTVRPLVSVEGIQAAKKYDAENKPWGSWQATSDDQAERIIVGWLLWLARTITENAP